MRNLFFVFLCLWISFAQAENHRDEHPHKFYYLSASVPTQDLHPGSDAKELKQLELDRQKIFKSGMTCEKAQSFEFPETVDVFFGDILDRLSICPQRRSAVNDLVTHAVDDLDLVISPLKEWFHRSRPFVDHSTEIAAAGGEYCIHKKHENPTTSFPSRHSAIAELQAAILSEIFPSHKREFEKRAFEVAESRELLSVHYPSDVHASTEIGRRVAKTLMGQNCEHHAHCFKTDLSKVKSLACEDAPMQKSDVSR